jgi:hypothetical protein
VYDFGSLVNAANGLNFIDSVTNDHDTVKVGNDAIGFSGTNAIGLGAVLAGPTEISLGAIRDNGGISATGFDFDVLDVTKVTNTTVTTLTGALAGLADFNTDEVVIGAINNINQVNGFESVVFTPATIAEDGTSYVLNTAADAITAGAKTLNGITVNTLSFGGTVLEQTGNLLRAPTDLNVTTGVTVTTTGAEAVNITGGNGNDSLTGNAGNDVLRGGAGNDTLDGSFVPTVAPVISYSLNGGAAVLGADGNRVTILGVTVEADTTPGTPTLNVPGAIPVVVGADSDTVGAAFAGVSLANWKTAITGAGTTLTAPEIASLQSVTYDAAANRLIFTFPASGSSAGIAQADFTAATVTGGTVTATLGNAADSVYTAAVQSADRYVFEATAALNGQDTILNFDATDTLDFRAFFANAGGGSTLNNTFTNLSLAGGYNLVPFGNTINVTYNKASLTAADFGGVTGRNIGDNTHHIFITTGDADGLVGGGDTTNEGYKIYMVQDIDPTAGITYQVDLIGSFTPSTELAPGAVGTAG